MAKLIDQIDSSGLFAQSAYSAAVATNDDLGRKISTTYLTAVDLSPYATTATTNTLSGQIEELSGTISSQMSLSAGEGINFVEDAENHRTRIDLGLSAGSNMSLVYDQETNTIRLDAEGGATYTGVAPIQVNNTTNEISISGETLSAGPGINIFESGGCVVISAGNDDYNFFPMTGTNGTTGFTANMDCSSMMLTTGASPAGGYVKQTVRGVQYEAYPATDVSASWYNIINATNNRSNCYCIRFTNDMTAASLEDYSAYDKVTVVHSNEYTQDCMLYWDGNTKVFPSGLYCELVKGTNDKNQTDWFFTTSGWINNVEWDWD